MELDTDYINQDSAIKRVGGNKGLYIRLLTQFIEGDHLGELETAIKAGDKDTAVRAAHTIKGICANLSLEKLNAAALTLEHKLKKDEDYSESLEDVRKIYGITEQQIALVTTNA